MLNAIKQQLINKHYFFWITIFLAVIMLGFYVFFISLLFRYGTYEKDLGWKSTSSETSYIISEITSDSDAVGKLKIGDKILAINNDTSIEKNYIILSNLNKIIRKIPVNSTYTIDISRDSIPYRYEITCKLKHNYRQLGILLTFFLCSFVFFICSFLIGIVKPKEKLTRQLSLTLFFTALFMLGVSIRLTIPFLEGLDYLFYLILSLPFPLVFPLAYSSYLQFPPGIARSKLWDMIKYFLYIYSIIIIVIKEIALLDLYKLNNIPNIVKDLFNNDFWLSVFDKTWAGLIQVTIVLLMLIIIRNYNITIDIDQRRRIKWVAYASIIGLVPLLIAHSITIFLSPANHKYVISTYSYFWFVRFAELFIIILPLSFVYVIVKHQVFDINVVVRRGLQYILAKNFLYLVLVSELLGIIAIIVFNPNLTVGEIFSPQKGYLYIVGFTFISFVYRTQMTSWLDKVFFPKAYNREKVLVNLIEEIKKLNSVNEISQMIIAKLEEVLHPKSAYFFYRLGEKEPFTLEHYRGNLSKKQHILDSSDLVQIIEKDPISKKLDFIDSLSIEEKDWLTTLGIQLIVPIVGQQKDLVGLFLLGGKRFDEPYSRNDSKLLEALAGQLGIIYENSLLKEKVAQEDRIKQNVISKLEEKNINLVKECPRCNKCFDSNEEFCDIDKVALTLSLPVERVIDGKYRLDKLIGKGGMGVVYCATDLRLARQVAVKILHGSLFGDHKSVKRFEREAKAAANLTHPNIVSIYDYGKILAEGAYLIMELVSGVSLADKINQEDCLSTKEVADLFDQIFEGMKVAHKAGIIHRDLKPANILICQENGKNKVKILDFGIAKIKRTDVTPNSVTEPGTIIGTFGYMPLEQFSAEDVDERADIFALGVMVIETLTGEKPFSGKTVYELMGNMMKKTFNLPGDLPEIKALDKVLQKCIAKEPSQRFSSITDMQKELIPAISQCPESIFKNIL